MQFTTGLTRILVLFLAAMGIQAHAIAASFNVTDATGLRAALVTAATNGEDDVIVLAAGTYTTGGTTFTFVTNETNTLTLQGATGTTRDQVVLDGGGISQVLNFSCVGSCGAVTLQGLTVQNGSVGGLNTVSKSLTLSDVVFSGNATGVTSGGYLTVTNSSFSNHAGVAIAVTNPTFSNNAGVAIGPVTVTNSSFSNNTGGAILAPSDVAVDVTVTNSSFSNNTATNGGAIFTYYGTVTVTNSSFSNNTAGSGGGAIASISGKVTVTNSSFINNNVTGGSGGAIAGFVNVTESTFSGNTLVGEGCGPFRYGNSRAGGAISGSGTVTNSSFSNNTSSCPGGAISGDLNVANSSFSNNTAGGNGGAIVGSGTVINSRFDNNTTTSFLSQCSPFCTYPLPPPQVVIGNGGAIFGSGTVVNSLFSNNTTGGNGGAISGGGTVTSSLFSNNSASGNGGAIATAGIVVNSTFSGNSVVGSGAAIYLPSAAIINSVFYGHTAPAIYATSAYNLYNNLIDTSTGIAGSSPLIGGNVAPGAASPFVDAANGNFQLAAGSPAVNAGLDPNSTTFADLVGGSNVATIRQALLTDAQGNPRPKPGTAVDIGAYESGTTVANPNAPTITGISRNYGSATIRFTTPPSFISYTVTCTASDQTTRTAIGPSSLITVQGLTGGASYSCSVSGSNGITTSVPSAAVPVQGQSVVPMMMQLLFD